MTFTPQTQVRLLSGVPFNQTYEHTRYFTSVQEQTDYFKAKTAFTFNEFTYQREEVAVKVNMGYDQLYNCNYLMYLNENFSGKWFYGFITRREYVNPNTTRIFFELDVLQTWMFDLQWKESFVEREHRQRWDANGRPIVNTVPEELNYGTEYRTVSASQYRPNGDVYYMVAACKQGMHGTVNKAYYANINGLPNLLVHYIHPFKLDGSTPGTNLGTLSSVADFLGGLYTQENAVNNIVSLYVTDVLPNLPGYNNGILSFDSSNYQNVTLTSGSVSTIFVSDMNYTNYLYDAGDKYTDYTTPEESKLLMYPYTVLELVDFKGNKATFKNEYIDNENILISIHSSLGTQNKVAYSIKDYLTDYLGDDILKQKVSLENGLISNDPQDMPILTDLLSAYLQGNRNSLNNQLHALQFKGLAETISGTGSTLISASLMGAKGALTGLANVGENIGSTYYGIMGINAKLKDIENTPPNLSKLGSNTYFDYGNGYTGLWIIKKEITEEYRKKLTDFFKLFGYKVNEVKLPNLHTRQSYNFVKTIGANITGNIPNEQLSNLKEVFDKGITLWHTDDVLNYSLANDELL
jgi:hypothetical protein